MSYKNSIFSTNALQYLRKSAIGYACILAYIHIMLMGGGKCPRVILEFPDTYEQNFNSHTDVFENWGPAVQWFVDNISSQVALYQKYTVSQKSSHLWTLCNVVKS